MEKSVLKNISVLLAVLLFSTEVICAGPYTRPGISGYVGSDVQPADPCDSDATVNPIFSGWATGYMDYQPTSGVDTGWKTPGETLGPATGNIGDIATLGDLSQTQIDQGASPGRITLTFGLSGQPGDEPIRDVNGLDFAVFENGVPAADYEVQAGLVHGEVFAELAYVEVSSSDPNFFIRFSSVSLTPEPIWSYGTVDITNIYNLAGISPNGDGPFGEIICTGTPFDLSELSSHPFVLDGTIDLNNIRYVRIVDIPGTGEFFDEPNDLINPDTGSNYQSSHPVYDPHETFGSGGFDLEAIGVLNEQNKPADINLDGYVDENDLYIFFCSWQSRMGDQNWNQRCDLAEPKDNTINIIDLAVITSQWYQKEKWALH